MLMRSRVRRGTIILAAFVAGAGIATAAWLLGRSLQSPAAQDTRRLTLQSEGALIRDGRQVSLDQAELLASFPIYRPTSVLAGDLDQVWVGAEGDPAVSLRFDTGLIMHLYPQNVAEDPQARAEEHWRWLVSQGRGSIESIAGESAYLLPASQYQSLDPDIPPMTEVVRMVGSVEVILLSPSAGDEALVEIAASLSAGDVPAPPA